MVGQRGAAPRIAYAPLPSPLLSAAMISDDLVMASVAQTRDCTSVPSGAEQASLAHATTGKMQPSGAVGVVSVLGGGMRWRIIGHSHAECEGRSSFDQCYESDLQSMGAL